MNPCLLVSDRGEYYVYVLFRVDGTPFYIGKGKGDRWNGHKQAALAGGSSHKDRVIRKILRSRFDVPKIKVCEGLSNSLASEIEIRLIAAIGRGNKGPLINETDGGDGTSGYQHTEKTKTKLRLIRSRWVPIGQHKANFVAAGRIASQSPKARKNRIRTLHRPEVKAKIDAARRKPRTDRARANLKAAQQRPEVREKIRKGNLGKKRTPEQKERHRTAIIKWWSERRNHEFGAFAV
jgi:hypothetical protein